MELTGRKKAVMETIENWEQSYFIDDNKNSYYSLETSFNQTIEGWRPNLQEKLLKTVDSIIFHTHAIAQNSKYDKETTAKVLDLGRVFNEDINKISDMKLLTIDQLRFIANQHLAKQRLISLTQGGFSGIGGFFTVALDLPLMLTINLRSIQLTAMTYGYDLNKPYELMLALKVFHVATLPKTMQKEGWRHLLLELDQFEDEWLLFDEKNVYKSTVWLQQPIKQIGKGLLLFLIRKKMIQGVPLLGITVGAAANYFLAKQVSELAHHFYQKRFLLENK
ncbi:EcsC family protein [Anaerobacillus isosaccharinicus]|uniref:EcsC family protein n=1 Tax=Anaerobacillus isosaccharinicus TaxID=1532552 RepID=A0A1S2LS65_9BACI|nr:EcsC family protein [Anaerobacillus isosaccharinicus]MBA5587961.1 EcsC family protein [Anaerobacillus isosaccharinicus]QOY33890.1 EcsC family protein [Anaerobacillus isosaccharinicus]